MELAPNHGVFEYPELFDGIHGRHPHEVARIETCDWEAISALLEMTGVRLIGNQTGLGQQVHITAYFRQHWASVPEELVSGSLEDWQRWIAEIVAKYPTAI